VRGQAAAFVLATALVACGGKTTAPEQPLDSGTGVVSNDAGAIHDATTVRDAGAATTDATTEASADALPCTPPLQDCGGMCVDTSDDPNNCGTCGAVCSGGLQCVKGLCAHSCPVGLTWCGTSCVNVQTDNANCGACDAGCASGFACTNGVCVSDCGDSGMVICVNDAGVGHCVDLQQDSANCGQCGYTCTSGFACWESQCLCECSFDGFVNCAPPGQCICVNPLIDNSHCGASGDCSVDAGTAGQDCQDGLLCINGTCTIVPCDPQFQIRCGNYCIVPATNNLFCGASGNCQGANAGVACAADQECVDAGCIALDAGTD
jgi:hypothetical protein